VAGHVILALAPTLYSTIRFEPSLPALKTQLAQRLPMGSIIKTITFYKTAWWRDAGFSGTLFDEHGPVVFSLDDTKPDGSYPAIMGFVLANNCRQLLDKSKEERQRLITQQYHRTWNIDEALTPLAYEEMNWCDERYSGGCYLAAFPPEAVSQLYVIARERKRERERECVCVCVVSSL
jgi:monoamine oxidase